jgi:hypothetical protein
MVNRIGDNVFSSNSFILLYIRILFDIINFTLCIWLLHEHITGANGI